MCFPKKHFYGTNKCVFDAICLFALDIVFLLIYRRLESNKDSKVLQELNFYKKNLT